MHVEICSDSLGEKGKGNTFFEHVDASRFLHFYGIFFKGNFVNVSFLKLNVVHYSFMIETDSNICVWELEA